MTQTVQVRIVYKLESELENFQIQRSTYHQEEDNNFSRKRISKAYQIIIF